MNKLYAMRLMIGKLHFCTARIQGLSGVRCCQKFRLQGVQMAGRPPEVVHVKESFFGEIKAAETLIRNIQTLPRVANPAKAVGIHPKHVSQITELAFMGVVAAWEEFLEMTLVRYVAGAKATGGYAPTPKFGQATSMKHAYQILSQSPKFDPAKHYLKVSETGWVTLTADFYFRSHSYGELRQKAELLNHASAIRNRVAHASEKCRGDFKNTALHFLQPANNKLTKGYTPGDLLAAKAERHFGQKAVQKGHTHFSAFLDMYRGLADKIVP